MRKRPPNVILTGFMGTGKSTVGRLLADRLDRRFVDTDAVIEHRHGSIPSIFANQGESAFRDIERTVADELSYTTRLVVSTGGRMLLDPTNVETLGSTGPVLCLVAEPGEIHRRLTSDPDGPHRPLLAGPDPRARIEELMAERAPHYQRFLQIRTDERTPEEIADEIAGLIDELIDQYLVRREAGAPSHRTGRGAGTDHTTPREVSR